MKPFPEEGHSNVATDNDVAAAAAAASNSNMDKNQPQPPIQVQGQGQVRLGVKRGYELFPGPLTVRVKEERQKQFHLQMASTLAQLRKKIVTWKEQYHPCGTKYQYSKTSS